MNRHYLSCCSGKEMAEDDIQLSWTWTQNEICFLKQSSLFLFVVFFFVSPFALEN